MAVVGVKTRLSIEGVALDAPLGERPGGEAAPSELGGQSMIDVNEVCTSNRSH